MKMLAYTFAMLIFGNVVLLLWPDDTSSAPHVYAAQEDINPHFVRLNKEIEAKFYSQATIETEQSPMTGSLQVAALSKSGQACYRLGPFMHIENYELAQAVLLNANLDYRKSKRVSKSSDVYRVFLGPFATQPMVADARLELKRKNILDHFVRKQEDGSYIISLGIYSTLESANIALRLFDGKLEGVQKQNETVVLPDSYWLHFSMSDQESARLQLGAMDWGEQSAKMGLYPCNG